MSNYNDFLKALKALRRPDLMNNVPMPATLILDRDHKGQIIVSAEDGLGFADYYGDGYPYIDQRLEEIAEYYGYFWEWETPGAIIAYEN